MFKRLLKVELQKSIKSKSMLVALVIGCIIIAYAVLVMRGIMQNSISIYENYLQRTGENSFYKMWGVYNACNFFVFHEFSRGFQFTMILPILVSLPFSWQFCKNWQTGYHYAIISRCGKWRYLFSQMLVAALSGLILTSAYCVFSLLFTTAFLPTYQPYVLGMVTNALSPTKLFGELYVNNTWLYFGIIIFIYLIYGIIFALLPILCSFVEKNCTFCLLAPFSIMYFGVFLEYISIINPKQLFPGTVATTFNPLKFLNFCSNNVSLPILIGISAFFLILAFLPLILWKRTRDIL